MANDEFFPDSRSTLKRLIQFQAMRLQNRLIKIVDAHDQLVDPETGKPPQGWLLPFRQLLRESRSEDYCYRLAYLLRYGQPRLRAIIVTLLGCSTGRFRLLGIDRYIQSADPTLRKHVAKALCRLEARSQLRRMAELWASDHWV